MSIYFNNSRINNRARKILGSLAAFLQDCAENGDFNTLNYAAQDIRALLDTVEASVEQPDYSYCRY